MQRYRAHDLRAPGLLRAWRHVDDGCAEHFLIPHHEVSLVALLSDQGSDLAIYGRRPSTHIYRPTSGIRSVGVVLAPEAVQRVTGISIGELVGHASHVPVGLREALGGTLEALTSLDTERALACWTRAVADLTVRAGVPKDPAAVAMARIREQRGQGAVALLAGGLGACSRTLRRRMQVEYGVTPKSYARLVRLSATVGASDGHCSPDWSDTAARFGYADQAHLVRDHRALTGLTPARLHARRGGPSEKFNTAA